MARPSIEHGDEHLPGGGHPVEKVTYHFKPSNRGPPVVFTVDKRYTCEKLLGEGACGVVAKGFDTMTQQPVAIKKLKNLFGHPIDAKRSLRELKVQAMLQHENLLNLVDLMVIDEAERDSFVEAYMVTELMETDLHRIIQSSQPLTDQHFSYFMYQILKGLKYLHSANVLHRDLKPANCLLNKDALLKICDFGLVKVDTDLDHVDPHMTPYVVTRWYRAPEIILNGKNYGPGVDIWAAGCVLAELLGRKAFMKGKSELDQIKMILDVCGRPPGDTISRIANGRARRFAENYTYPPTKPWREHFPEASEMALDVLDKMMTFDPDHRMSAEALLEHPYFAAFHDVAEEVTCPHPFIQFDFENTQLEIPTIRRLIYNEMLRFHPEQGTYIPSTTEHALALTDEERANMVVNDNSDAFDSVDMDSS